MDGRSRALLALLIATTDGLQRTIRLPGKRCAALGATGPSWAHDGVSHRAFGVEIELLSDDVDDLADAVARAGEDVIIANTVTRVTTKAWKIVPDLSLPYDCGFELVSPILRGHDGRRRLVNVMNQINSLVKADFNGAFVEALGGVCRLAPGVQPTPVSYVNVQCGLHVHVDLTDIKFAGVRRICQNWAKYEDAIDLFLPQSRRGNANRFCQSVRYNDFLGPGTNKQVNDYIGACEDIYDLMECINPITAEDDSGRYYKLNLRTGNKNTIEFRAHSGTTDTEKLKRWINFVVAFVENSARNPEPLSFYDDRDAVHKFHRLFEWVVRGENMHRFYYGRALELNQ